MSSAERLLGLGALAAANLLYLLPLLVAAKRDVPQLRRIVLLNVLLGWTVVGWLYCLWLALRPARRAAPTSPGPRRPGWQDPSLQDRAPGWLTELPAHERTWRALPRDTAPLPLDPDAEQP